MSYYRVTAEPAELPITVADVKPFMRIDFDQDDSMIEAMIRAATTTLEAFTNRDFVTRTYQYTTQCLLPPDQYTPQTYLELQRGPLGAVTSAEYRLDSNQVTLEYTLQERSSYARLWVEDGETIDTDEVPNAFTVVFTSGYGAAADVPPPLKEAIKRFVLFQYENKDDTIPDTGHIIPAGVQFLARPYRLIAGYS